MTKQNGSMDSVGDSHGRVSGADAERPHRPWLMAWQSQRLVYLVRSCAEAPFRTTIDASSTMTTLHSIWWKIYPNDDEHRWMPLIWLPFMVWFFVDPLWKHAGPLGWTTTPSRG